MFYPDLPDAGKQEAQRLIDLFKDNMRKAANDVLGELYCDVAVHIESDSWTNYRNKLMSAFRNYGNRLTNAEHDFKDIRQQIFKEFRDDIIKDLDQDNLKRIKDLEEQLKYASDMYSRSI